MSTLFANDEKKIVNASGNPNLMLVCILRDNAANNYLSPVLFPTLEVYKRNIYAGVNNLPETHEMRKFPSNFDLCTIGTFNICTGELVGLNPSKIINLKELLDGFLPDNA